MKPKERKEYRINLLKEIYDCYFQSEEDCYKITLNIKEDREKYLAVQYLMDRNYIVNKRPDYDNYSLIITLDGIDLIERAD